MKAAVTTLLVLCSLVCFSKPKPKEDHKVLSTKHQTLYFKVNKAFIGGTVEVYDSNMMLLESEALSHTHTMVYFEEMPLGVYTIKVKKADKVTALRYMNI